MKNFALLFALLMPCKTIASSTYSVKKLSEIDKHIKNILNAWLVFDIDNTIITPTKEGILATDGFYYSHKKFLYDYLKSSGMSEEKALKEAYLTAVPAWNTVVEKETTPYQTIEKITAEWIKDKQKMGFKTIAHTAREPVLFSRTIEQLGRFSISFDSSVKLQIDAESVYENAIYMVGRGGVHAKNHKGKKFVELINALKAKGLEIPSYVIFIDDRMEHVKGMAEELEKIKIPFLGFHYAAISEKD